LDHGAEPRQFSRELLDRLRALMLVKGGSADLADIPAEAIPGWMAQAEALSMSRLVNLIKLLNEAANQLKSGIHSQLPLELAIVEASLAGDGAGVAPVAAAPATAKAPEIRGQAGPASAVKAAEVKGQAGPASAVQVAEVKGPAVPAVTIKAAEASVTAASATPAPAASKPELPAAVVPVTSVATGEDQAPIATAPDSADSMSLGWLQDNWGRLLLSVREHSRSVEALLKSCEPMAVKGDVVVLGFYHSFHKERVAEEKNRKVVEDSLQELGGRHYRVQCQLYEGNAKEREQQTDADRRDKLLDNPMVSEAVKRYGARVIDVQ
jgi:DNA polymerase III subunit gamma/tau